MGADFELSINQNGQPSLLYIDKGNNKVKKRIASLNAVLFHVTETYFFG